MKRVGIIGLGYWGNILYSKLEKICDVRFTCRSSDSYLDKLHDVDLVFVSTPDSTHYDIVKNCLLAGKHVFCEKPLTPTHSQSQKLFHLAERENVKLYVDDVQNYRNYDFKISKNNFIERQKSGGGDIKDILCLLTYHDLYVLYDAIKDSKIKNIIPIKVDDVLHFKIEFDYMSVEFLYDLNHDTIKHCINGYSLMGEDDAVLKMLSAVLNDDVDFSYNKKISLFANKIIDILYRELF